MRSDEKQESWSSFFKNWQFARYFQWNKETEQNQRTKFAEELQSMYPEEAEEAIEYLARVLRRRASIVEKLEKYPELNDHGFFMVICKMYMDTYRGVSHTRSRLAQLIAMFATSDVSVGTGDRKLTRANEVGIFTTPDTKDGQKQAYYLHPDMIAICSEVFIGMMNDALEIRGGVRPGKGLSDDQKSDRA